MTFQNVQLNNEKILSGEKIGELVTEIVNKFSESRLLMAVPGIMSVL